MDLKIILLQYLKALLHPFDMSEMCFMYFVSTVKVDLGVPPQTLTSAEVSGLRKARLKASKWTVLAVSEAKNI